MLPEKTLSDPGFLPSVRALMDSGGGMFAARDGAFRYVFFDADFYTFDILRKHPRRTFTETALSVPYARAVANGQMFPRYCPPVVECVQSWEGEIIDRHVTLPGSPPSFPLFRFFGKTDGASIYSYRVSKGDPGSSGIPLATAMGRLLPLVERKVLSANHANNGTMWERPATCGKIVYGRAENINAIFVLAQQDGEVGLTIRELGLLLVALGVDDAVQGDGSNSATLVVGGVVESVPGWLVKDRSISHGPMFYQVQLDLVEQGSWMSNGSGTTDFRFLMSFSVRGLQGSFRLTNDRLQLELASLGYRSDNGRNLATDVGVSLPISLERQGAEMPSITNMRGADGRLNLIFEKDSDAFYGQVLNGRLVIQTGLGQLALSLRWQLLQQVG